MIDSRKTVAAALGGDGLHEACFRLGRSRLFKLVVTCLQPVAISLFVYILTTGTQDTTILPLYYAVMGIYAALTPLQLLLLNAAVLRGVVLRRFDTYWSFANIWAAAFLGAALFKDPSMRAVWLMAQLQTSTYYLQDAAPPSVLARRIASLGLACYAAVHVYSVIAIWLRAFDVQDRVVDVFGVPVNLRHWCFSAQVNATIIAMRFAARALADQRNLMFATGLIRVRLTAADARELRAIMLAERNVRSVQYRFADSSSVPPASAMQSSVWTPLT